MKSRKLLTGILLVAGLSIATAQNIASTTTLTSGGNLAGSVGSGSSYYGYMAGNTVTTGYQNTLIGNLAGKALTTGSQNAVVGYNTASKITSGYSNTILGSSAGLNITSGNSNLILGFNAGSNGNSSSNTYLGANTGISATGSNNVFIGHGAGYLVKENNILVIDNEANARNYFIWGDFANELLKFNAKVGIGGVENFPATAGGVDLTSYKLFVKGGLLANEIRVTNDWADYVFEDNYKLPTIYDVECFILENKHLPNVPSAKQVEAEGISLGEMAKIQQAKIEELTLYIIQQDKQLKEQNIKIEKLEQQKKELNDLKLLVYSLIDYK